MLQPGHRQVAFLSHPEKCSLFVQQTKQNKCPSQGDLQKVPADTYYVRKNRWEERTKWVGNSITGWNCGLSFVTLVLKILCD